MFPIQGAGNRPGALIFTNQVNDTFWKQFSPRFGIAYRVKDKIVVRGRLRNSQHASDCKRLGLWRFLYGFNGTVNVPALGNINQPALYLANPFPVLSQPLPNRDPSSAEFTTATTTARNANRPGYTHNYNVTIQYQLPKDTVLEAAYVGNKGTRMWGGTAYNEYDALPASLLSKGSLLNEPVSAHPEYTSLRGVPDHEQRRSGAPPVPSVLRGAGAIPV